ncbi:MAG: methyltransferase domain-containing protein [Candidatus Omnitrophica bacterium]|nr:methyltransferase domain-containing protein [Candidatus Omnitrophota bacterium]
MKDKTSGQAAVEFPFYYGFKLDPKRRRAYFTLLKYIFDGKYRLEHVKKCLCGSDDLEVLSVQDRFVLPFGTKICRQCGLIQVSPRLSFNDLPEFYEKVYYDLILGESIRDLMTVKPDSAEKIYEYLDRYVTRKEAGRRLEIIEIGCGRGALLDKVRNLLEKDGIAVDVCGCEPSEDASQMARSRGIDVYKGLAESLAGKKADIVILSHVVEHFGDIKSEFNKIKPLVKEGGYLYVEVPGVCYLKDYDYNYIVYSAFVHNYNFNLLSLRSVIEPLGFKFIAGDEYVRSLFRCQPSHVCGLDLSNNYFTIISTLKQLEEKRLSMNKSRAGRLIRSASRIKSGLLKLLKRGFHGCED